MVESKEKNIKLLESLGVEFGDGKTPRNRLTINLVENTGLQIRTPITFTMGEADLDRICQFIRELGVPGKKVVKALTKSIKTLANMDKIENVEIPKGTPYRFVSVPDWIINNFWVVGYSPEDVINYFCDTLMETLRYHKFPVIPIMELTRESTAHFLRSFGGSKGVQMLFLDIVYKTAKEFCRIHTAEVQMNVDKIESELSSDQLGSIPVEPTIIRKQCYSCKHCLVLKPGFHWCMKKPRPIPETLSVATVNDRYPSARIHDCTILKSRYILHEVHSCEDYRSRAF